MTKERKLAIEMWQDIRDKLLTSLINFDVEMYKRKFCKEHDLEWKHSCWFCRYIPYCSKCPLRDCSTYSDYDNVVNDRRDRDKRVEACNAIIKALGGEV